MDALPSVGSCPACRGTGAQGLGPHGPLTCELANDHQLSPDTGVALVPTSVAVDWWIDRMAKTGDAVYAEDTG